MKIPLKKILLLCIVSIIGLGVFADEQEDALKFFESVVSASNNYSPSLLNMYSNHAKIIREVIKPDGKKVDVYFSAADYKNEMKRNAKFAKIVNYKNEYSNIKVTKVSNGFKIDAMRKPSASTYKLRSHMIVQKQPDGKWLVVEELMQTKIQTFLKYAK